MARILLLDDSPLILSATKLALEAAGHQVQATSEPAEFFTALKKHEPDLALVDVQMPALEGDAVVWIARAHQLHACRIVLYSAKDPADLEKLVRSSGADGFIAKTSDENALRAKVAEALKVTAPAPTGQAPG